MRTLALLEEVGHWSLTSLREKLVKMEAKVVRHLRYVTFQLAEVAVPRTLFQKILTMIDDLRRRPVPASAEIIDDTMKIRLSDASERKQFPTILQNGYGWSEFDSYLGNIGWNIYYISEALRNSDT